MSQPTTVKASIQEDEASALATRVAAQVASGKITFAEVWGALSEPPSAEVAKPGERTAPVVKAITDQQRLALSRLPEVYGSVVPLEDRALTEEELVRIVEERETIDTILALVKTRKDDSIRETLANHLDHVLVFDEEPPVDSKGHYQVKQEVHVEGTSKKIQKTVSNPKPVLTAEAVLDAYERGEITRETYLAITKVPDVPRVLDEAKMAKAVKKDPSLLLTLSRLAKTPAKTTTIKVVND